MSFDKKGVKDLVKELRARGYIVEHQRGGHYAVRNTDGKRLATVPVTPSNSRWRQSTIRNLRHAGIDLKEET